MEKSWKQHEIDHRVENIKARIKSMIFIIRKDKRGERLMSLAYKNDTYNYNGEYEMGSLNKFARTERRLSAKKQALDDMKNEYDLIEQQTFRTYKENIQYMLLDQTSTIKTCREWLNMLSKNQDADGNKLDKRKKYKEKETYDWYIDYIKKLLDIEYMNDVKFIDFNFGQATNIQFEYKEHNWYLEIPHIKAIKLDEYRNYGGSVFKLALMHNDTEYSCSWSQFGSTYEEDELRDIMTQGIEKYCN